MLCLGFVMEKAEEYTRFRTLETFASFIALQVREGGSKSVDRIARVFRGMVADMEQQFDRAALNDQISRFVFLLIATRTSNRTLADLCLRLREYGREAKRDWPVCPSISHRWLYVSRIPKGS